MLQAPGDHHSSGWPATGLPPQPSRAAAPRLKREPGQAVQELLARNGPTESALAQAEALFLGTPATAGAGWEWAGGDAAAGDTAGESGPMAVESDLLKQWYELEAMEQQPQQQVLWNVPSSGAETARQATDGASARGTGAGAAARVVTAASAGDGVQHAASREAGDAPRSAAPQAGKSRAGRGAAKGALAARAAQQARAAAAKADGHSWQGGGAAVGGSSSEGGMIPEGGSGGNGQGPVTASGSGQVGDGVGVQGVGPGEGVPDREASSPELHHPGSASTGSSTVGQQQPVAVARGENGSSLAGGWSGEQGNGLAGQGSAPGSSQEGAGHTTHGIEEGSTTGHTTHGVGEGSTTGHTTHGVEEGSRGSGGGKGSGSSRGRRPWGAWRPNPRISQAGVSLLQQRGAAHTTQQSSQQQQQQQHRGQGSPHRGVGEPSIAAGHPAQPPSLASSAVQGTGPGQQGEQLQRTEDGAVILSKRAGHARPWRRTRAPVERQATVKVRQHGTGSFFSYSFASFVVRGEHGTDSFDAFKV